MRQGILPRGRIETAASAHALAVRFGPLPFSAMRRVRRVLTDTPRSRRFTSASSVRRTSDILRRLVRAGLAMKPGAGYVRSGTAMPVLDDDAVPMEIGRQILLCLTEPRRTRDIARIIDRSPSNTTGQLQHLLRRGLVVRVGKGVYELAQPDKRHASMTKRAKQRPQAVGWVRPPTEGRVPSAPPRCLESA
jgi:hypothetical protein